MKGALLTLLAIGLVFGAGCSDTAAPVLDAQAWMTILPVQCGGNAWSEGEGDPVEYYEGIGVPVFDFQNAMYTDAVCASCACFTGERLDMLIDAGYVELLRDDGWVPQGEFELLIETP